MRVFSVSSILILAASVSAAPQTWTQSLVGGSNTAFPGGITPFAFEGGTGALTTATATQSFTGLDRTGQTQTMTFSGVTRNSAEFGRLRSYTEGHVTNLFYNASNEAYANGGGGVNDPNGTPDSLCSLGFAGFDDTLYFGGSLQTGYKARYIFRVDGTNSGQGYLADLSVQIADDPAEAFFASSPGYEATTWATASHEINGITPQQIHVQFSNQIVFDTFDLEDGGNYSGISDFSSTLTLAKIEITDANGMEVDGVTVTSASGTVYPVPEPASFVALGIGVAALKRRWRHA